MVLLRTLGTSLDAASGPALARDDGLFANANASFDAAKICGKQDLWSAPCVQRRPLAGSPLRRGLWLASVSVCDSRSDEGCKILPCEIGVLSEMWPGP